MAAGQTAANGSLAGIPRRVLYYGTDQPLPRQIPLRAGPLHLIFEPDLAQIRRICLGDREVLRAVYGAVRDHNWGTVLPQVRDLVVTTEELGFEVRFVADCRNQDVDFTWQGELRGEADGTIRFTFHGQAHRDFHRNRIGFNILHPVDTLPGQPVRVESVDGSLADGRMPNQISPHQPFLNLRAITHEVQPGVHAEVRMEGDTFEMEDQRNWTDASYKTYSTPLGLPFPVEVPKNAEVQQTVTLRLLGNPQTVESLASAEVSISMDPKHSFPLPPVGAVLAQDCPPLTEAEVQRLRSASIAHLRVDLKLFEASWSALLHRACSESRSLRVPLELAVHVSNEARNELAALAEALGVAEPAVVRMLVFHRGEKSTTQQWMEMARELVRPVLEGVPLGSGSPAYFTEVNRGRPPLAVSDFVAWSINPQVHAFDNMSLAETMPMHQTTLESARSFCGDLPLVVSPVSLKPRFNPTATVDAANASHDTLPETVDPRQLSLFGAGWTLGSLKYLARGRASAITMYETTGWRGWMETQAGSPLPALFRSQPGWAFPLYHVLADWGEFVGGDLLGCDSAQPLAVEAAALRKSNRLRLLLANLSNQTRAVRLPAADVGTRLMVKRLDEHSVIEAMQHPERWRSEPGTLFEPERGHYQISLLPYAVIRLDRSEG